MQQDKAHALTVDSRPIFAVHSLPPHPTPRQKGITGIFLDTTENVLLESQKDFINVWFLNQIIRMYFQVFNEYVTFFLKL